MRHQSTTVEEILADLGGRSYGVVTREQLLAERVSVGEIVRRVRKGLLIRQFPGVYRVGHQAPSVEASYLAAVKAAGNDAGLSGRAAAYHLGLIKGKPPPPQVTAPTKHRLKGVRVKRGRPEKTIVRGIPVTTVAQTLVDLAAEMDAEELARACHEAGVKYGTAPRHVEAILAKYPNAPGAGKLRAIMRGDAKVTLSELERGFLDMLRKHRLPLPETNRVAGGRRVDCRWPNHHLTVELDSYQFHNSRYAWEQSYQREREARGREDEFRRYTWRDVFEQPAPMLRELRKLLPSAWTRSPLPR
jgi:hypothetical protein